MSQPSSISSSVGSLVDEHAGRSAGATPTGDTGSSSAARPPGSRSSSASSKRSRSDDTLPLFASNAALGLPKFDLWHVEQRDATEFLAGLPVECLDLCVTDPAYSSLEKHRAKGTTTRLKKSKASSNEWFPVVPNAYFMEFFRALYRALKKKTHAYVMCDHETMRAIVPMAEAAGFKFWKPIVWDRVRIGMGYHYRARYEFVLFFEKGKRNLADLSVPDVLSFKGVRNAYPTEKPVELLSTFVRQSSEPGQLVCDPFMGSASAGAAALCEGRRFIGCDVSDAALKVARARLTELTLSDEDRIVPKLGVKPDGWRKIACDGEDPDEKTYSSPDAGQESSPQDGTPRRRARRSADGT